MDKAELREIINDLRDWIAAGDSFFTGGFLTDKAWNISDVVEFLVIYKLMDDQVSDQNLGRIFESTSKHYLSVIKEGMLNGKIRIIKGLERKQSKPQFLPMLSLRYNLRSYLSYVGGRIERLNPANRLLAEYILPADAFEFAISKGWPMPPNFSSLLRATSPEVSEPLQLPASGSIPGVNGVLVEIDDSRIHILSTLKLKGLHTDLILPEIEVNDLRSLYKLISPPEKADPPNLADKNERNRQRKIRAINYMLRVIKSGCLCRHSDLAKVAIKNSSEWEDADGKRLSDAQLKELSILIVPPKRRYRKNQATGETPYDPSACKCEHPDHT